MSQNLATGPSLSVTEGFADRCDRCGAAGKLQATLPAGTELTFCGHHANLFADNLRSAAAHVLIELGFGWRGALSA